MITGVGCSALTVSVTKGGTNYINDSDVETFAVTGKGSGLRLNMTASNGAVSSINGTFVAKGNGYQVGDVVGIVTSSAGNQGNGAEITIASIDGIDTLFLNNIQADNTSNGFQDGTQIKYFNDAGTAVAMIMTNSMGAAKATNELKKAMEDLSGDLSKTVSYTHLTLPTNREV